MGFSEHYILQGTDWRGEPIMCLSETEEGLIELERVSLGLSGTPEDHIAADIYMREPHIVKKMQEAKKRDAAIFWFRLQQADQARKDAAKAAADAATAGAEAIVAT